MLGESGVVAYIRVSSDKQVEKGRSLEDQDASIRRYCEMNNLRLEDAYEDRGISGNELHRPDLDRLLEHVRSGNVELVVVSHIDRLTRNGLHLKVLLDAFHEAGVRLVTTDDRFGGKQRGLDSRRDAVTMDAVVTFAQWQRDRISDATKRAQRNLKRLGKPFSRDLYGFDVHDGELVPNWAEVAVLRVIHREAQEDVPHRQIARNLNAAGHTGKRGGEWSAKTVRDQLKRLKNPDLEGLYAPLLYS